MSQMEVGVASGARFEISLAQYSVHRKIGGGGSYWIRMAKRLKHSLRERPRDFFQSPLDPIDFPEFARKQFDIGAVEYVSGFYPGRARDEAYIKELKKRSDGAGVRNVLIMVDNEGVIGSPDKQVRAAAVQNHHKWIDTAATLGCHSIRAIAASDSSLPRPEQQDLVADGLSQLLEYSKRQNINVIVENKGGVSCDAQWLCGVMDKVNDPMVGTLPDFGNFKISDTEFYDYIKGTRELMPYAKSVSVKAFDFDANGMEANMDFEALIDIVVKSGYRGYLGLEYEGCGLSEIDGIKATKSLVEKLLATHQV